MRATSDRGGGTFVTVLLFVALVGLHVATGMFRSTPIVFPDELGYLGPARYFAGGTLPLIGPYALYHPGYSLAITPASFLNDPAATYKAVMATNALFIGLLFLVLLALLRRMEAVTVGRARLIAVTASVYPSLLPGSKLARGEALLALLFVLAVLAVIRLVESKSSRWGVVLGVCSGYLYSVHGRGVAVVFATAVIVAVLWMRSQIPRRVALAALGSMGVAVLLALRLNDLVRSGAYTGRQGLRESFTAALDVGAELPRWLFFGAAGQFWYLVAATYGLVVLGAVRLWQIARDASSTSGQRTSAVCVLLAAVTIFSISTAFMVNGPRGDHLIYGRYNEIFVPIFLVFGCMYLFRVQRRLLTAALVVASLSVTGALIPLGPNGENVDYRLATGSILALDPIIRIFGGLHLVWISGAACVIALLILAVTRGRREVAIEVAIVVVAGLFLATGLSTFFLKTMPAERKFSAIAHMPELIKARAIERVSFDLTAGFRERLRSYQFRLQRTRFDLFDSSLELPRSRYVLGRPDWPAGWHCGASRLFADRAHGLWYVPGDTASCLLTELGR